MNLSIKRVYESPSSSDGKRILVDRLWPRGLSKAQAEVDLWFKEIAPSTKLRKWYKHDEVKWDEFKERYIRELESNPILPELKSIISKETVTLVYGYRNIQYNHAAIIYEYIKLNQ